MVVHIIVEGTVYFMYKEIFCPQQFYILLFKRKDGFFHQHILAAQPLNLNTDVIFVGDHEQFFFQVFECIVDGRYR